MRTAAWLCVLLTFAPLAAGQEDPLKAIERIGRGCSIGVTRSGEEIVARLPPHARDLAAPVPRVVVIGGNDGTRESAAQVRKMQKVWEGAIRGPNEDDNFTGPPYDKVQPAFAFDIYPVGAKGDSSDAIRGYPPKQRYYDDPDRPESRYLWRWIGMYGADLVVDVRSGKENCYWLGGDVAATKAVRDLLNANRWAELPAPAADDFARVMSGKGAEDLGSTPVLILQLTQESKFQELDNILLSAEKIGRSPAHAKLLKYQQRTAAEISAELTKVYGQDLKQVAYIPALAVIGRLRSAELFKDVKESKSLSDLLEPFRNGQSNPIPKSGSEQAGHLIFAEMAKRSEGKDRERWIELCRAAADQIFDKDGKPRDLMPYYNEMSDAVFMATPILCATGKLTGEKKYHDAAVTHFRNMKKLCLREDGLYRHSPLDEAAWGRGNGFPALGLGWALSEFPEDHPAFPELKADFQKHIAALLKHQDEFGCWHQVIDKPGSYREFSATCMIGWALKRGIDRGWLDKEHHQPALQRAWIAAKQRIHDKGVVVDICTGTGKQKSLREYYDRPAIWGVDARGGAMALMFATEMLEKN